MRGWDGQPKWPQCVAMIRSTPATASATPATIVLAVLIFNAGICAATSQRPAITINKKLTSASVTPV
jgi:hypothetical protein